MYKCSGNVHIEMGNRLRAVTDIEDYEVNSSKKQARTCARARARTHTHTHIYIYTHARAHKHTDSLKVSKIRLKRK